MRSNRQPPIRLLCLAIAAGGVVLGGCAKARTPHASDAATTVTTHPAPTMTSPAPDNSDHSHSAEQRAQLQEQLSPLQFNVVCNEATEPPFRNAYWDNKAAGIYVDVVSGRPLFSSLDKFDSGTGWPSFTRPLEETEIIEKADTSHGMARTEVRSKSGKAHLGHLFPDGPAPTGLRYCINSAALRFIPLADLEKEGYGEYRALFGNP